MCERGGVNRRFDTFMAPDYIASAPLEPDNKGTNKCASCSVKPYDKATIVCPLSNDYDTAKFVYKMVAQNWLRTHERKKKS